MSEVSLSDPTDLLHAHLLVSRALDGRYCVIYVNHEVRRRSYASLPEQVIQQAQRAGGIPIRTDDDALRQYCQDHEVPLI
jgi:hypothetical protein